MAQYIVIKTLFDTYKCHAYRLKNSRVYFNSRAINLGNVVSITLKDETVAYENVTIDVVKPKRVCAHHVSRLKGAEKCKATVVNQKALTKKSTISSRLPDVIEI
ncbi:MAG: hypothetical protein WC365_01385 [Candidatus Babeliales bacterium]|jgi:hypothetical protein